ncbi:DUF2690 domain-containing protein [Streptomyces bikiniensis]|uniref:DUF2690 domain-containing protein n=1 Tax=Streptomyces bikiniensis TaxID=1896 RepID=A0ABW8CRW8_STRBI
MPGWKALPEELDPEVRAFTERIRRLIDRSGLGVTALAERTGHERASWDAYLNARRPVPRGAVTALADVTGADPADLVARWERTRGRVAPEGTAPGGPEGDGSGSDRADLPDGPGDDSTMRIRRLAPERPAKTPDPRPAESPGPRPALTPDQDQALPPDQDQAPTPSPRKAPLLLYLAGVLGALLVVTAALLLVDLGGAGEGADAGADGRASAPPTTPAPSPPPRTGLPAGVKCSGADCAGQDPEAMGCGGPLAVTVARVRVGTAGVEVRHSATCSASWARITGAAPGDTVSVEVAGATERATVPEGADTAAETDAYTPMLAVAPRAAARACGTLADGTRACTAGR